jgi:CRISPR/Cas system CSM-associated protein Csm3 (group 7 of RAMP superfamily)
MNQIAFLWWDWRTDSPLHTGYSQNLAEFTGRRERGSRQSINLETHVDPDTLQPAFLASSVKGVFRQAAAWLLERSARELGETRFVTCDYAGALDTKWQQGPDNRLTNHALCPACQVFGGAGCRSALGKDASAGVQRLKSPVSFGFGDRNDAFYGETEFSPGYFFTWQQLLNKGQALQVEQLKQAENILLLARLDPASSFSLALLWLAADLISSGAFRFGRFSSRGYGVVRLKPAMVFQASMAELLDEPGPTPKPVVSDSGFAIAEQTLTQNPLAVVNEFIQKWLQDSPVPVRHVS